MDKISSASLAEQAVESLVLGNRPRHCQHPPCRYRPQRKAERRISNAPNDRNSGGEQIPVQWQVKDKDVDEPNGTTVSILDINLERLKRASIIEYVERHLQAFRATAPAVAIDDHVCSYREPETAETQSFEPSEAQRAMLSDVRLAIKVACAPLTPS
jgi:hypothetical protein